MKVSFDAFQKAQQAFTAIDPSLNTDETIKNFIFPHWSRSAGSVDREATETLIQEYLKTRDAYQMHLMEETPGNTLEEKVIQSQQAVLQLDPALLGEKRYEDSDWKVVQFAKWAFYGISALFTFQKTIDRMLGRYQLLKDAYTLDLDQQFAVAAFPQFMQGFYSGEAPQTVADIERFFHEQPTEANAASFQQAKEQYQHFLSQNLSHSLEETFGMRFHSWAEPEVEEVAGEKTETADQIVYTGDLARQELQRKVVEALTQKYPKEDVAEFLSKKLIPPGVTKFIVSKNERKFEAHFEGESVGIVPKIEEHGRKNALTSKFVAAPKIVFTYDDQGKLTFEEDALRAGVVAKAFGTHIKKLPGFLQGGARKALGDFIEHGLYLSVMMNGMQLTETGVRFFLTPLEEGEREIPMDEGIRPNGFLGGLIKRFMDHDDMTDQQLLGTYPHMTWSQKTTSD